MKLARTSLATTLVVALMAVAPGAHAADPTVPCTYDDATGEMQISVVDVTSITIAFAADGSVSVNALPCSADPMLGLLDRVVFTGGPALHLTIDGRDGSFANGRGADPGGVAEVKYRFENSLTDLALTVLGTAGDDGMVAGTNGADITGDGDIDVHQPGITAVNFAGLHGKDLLSTMGGGPSGSPLVVPAVLDGGADDDTLQQVDLDGSGFRARLVGGFGSDLIEASGGSTTLDYSGSSVPIRVDLRTGVAMGQGTDTLNGVESVWGSPFDDKLIGGKAASSFRAGEGDDLLVAGPLGGWLDGGPGRDTVSYGQAGKGVTASLATGKANWGPARLVGVESILGSIHRDVLAGNTGGNRLDGGGGDDTLSGGAGPDILLGGAGNDLLLGGAGTDQCRQGPGHGSQRACEN